MEAINESCHERSIQKDVIAPQDATESSGKEERVPGEAEALLVLEMAGSALREIRDMVESGELPDLRDRRDDINEEGELQEPTPSSKDEVENDVVQSAENPTVALSYNCYDWNARHHQTRIRIFINAT
ncbi:hypothetical protein GE061_014804 [Apolygus lucorum]|uniref:Uncharacterized protein n=1 Tax=Apolygus lucorum TaxID=248454 RepID=A0A8S9XLA2_APOLU|nr:hypothetical protein GE061_014804 [Apolygus lucorum]